MRRRVVITAGDVLTPLGDLEATWDHLMHGETGLRLQEVENMQGRWPLGFIDGASGPIGSPARFSNVLQRLLTGLPELDSRTLLICSTTKGAVDQLLYEPSNDLFQPWNLAEGLAAKTGLKDFLTVSGACSSGALAVINGAMRIASGEYDQVLAVGIDLVSEFVLTGFDSLKALSPTSARPFDRKRDGLSLGDGAAWLLLQAEETADRQYIRAVIEGYGVSCDASHITAPCRYASGLKAALKRVQKMSDMPVGGVHAHGTGTLYNDAMELKAFSELYDAAMPLCSGKGALGHSLGAAGAIEILLSIKCLDTGMLHPTVGLREPEENSCRLSGTRPLALLSKSVLTTNSGFGGINSAMLLSQSY